MMLTNNVDYIESVDDNVDVDNTCIYSNADDDLVVGKETKTFNNFLSFPAVKFTF